MFCRYVVTCIFVPYRLYISDLWWLCGVWMLPPTARGRIALRNEQRLSARIRNLGCGGRSLHWRHPPWANGLRTPKRLPIRTVLLGSFCIFLFYLMTLMLVNKFWVFSGGRLFSRAFFSKTFALSLGKSHHFSCRNGCLVLVFRNLSPWPTFRRKCVHPFSS